MTTLEITARVLLRAEAARVWEAAMDWPRQGDWMLATRVRGGRGAGAEVVARTGVVTALARGADARPARPTGQPDGRDGAPGVRPPWRPGPRAARGTRHAAR